MSGDPAAQVRELAARLHLRLKNYEKAAQHYEEILKLAPGDEKVLPATGDTR